MTPSVDTKIDSSQAIRATPSEADNRKWGDFVSAFEKKLGNVETKVETTTKENEILKQKILQTDARINNLGVDVVRLGESVNGVRKCFDDLDGKITDYRKQQQQNAENAWYRRFLAHCSKISQDWFGEVSLKHIVAIAMVALGAYGAYARRHHWMNPEMISMGRGRARHRL